MRCSSNSGLELRKQKADEFTEVKNFGAGAIKPGDAV
jgi:hypothetical protein